MEIYEHGKKREIILDGGYEYRETLCDENGEILKYFSMCAYSDYSFYFVNASREPNRIIVEIDSAFYQAFLGLLEGISELRINSDFSKRFIEFKMNDDKEIEIICHLLDSEMDGSIEVKNIMHDFRSQADSQNTDIKARLNKFFNLLLQIKQDEKIEMSKKKEL